MKMDGEEEEEGVKEEELKEEKEVKEEEVKEEEKERSVFPPYNCAGQLSNCCQRLKCVGTFNNFGSSFHSQNKV